MLDMLHTDALSRQVLAGQNAFIKGGDIAIKSLQRKGIGQVKPFQELVELENQEA
mgnify:CR=1 FL=1